jgi:hypothetical protein
LYANSDPNLIE